MNQTITEIAVNDLTVSHPPEITPRSFTSAKDAVDMLCEIYETNTQFLRDNFRKVVETGASDVRYRAYYPEIRFSNN